MQKTLFVVAALCASAACASPLIITDAIPLTGSGSWFKSLDQNGSTVSAYGASNGHSASFSVQSCLSGPSGIYASTGGGCSYDMTAFGALIDDVRSHIYTVSLVGGIGSLELFDGSNNLLASAVLAGNIVETSHETINRFESQGTFVITPTDQQSPAPSPSPEPSSAAMIILAMILSARKAESYRRAR